MIVNYDPETFIVQATDVIVSQAKKYKYFFKFTLVHFNKTNWSNVVKYRKVIWRTSLSILMLKIPTFDVTA